MNVTKTIIYNRLKNGEWVKWTKISYTDDCHPMFEQYNFTRAIFQFPFPSF